MSNSVLAYLLSRGDKVSIINGKLIVEASSGKPIPDDWLSNNECSIIVDCLNAVGVNAYFYTGYTTGNYGSHKSSGITLKFTNIKTEGDAFICFNANLKHLRNSKHVKKGSALPVGQFSVTSRSGFYKFWSDTKLPLPTSLTRFYMRMGKLKTIVFSANILTGEKLDKKTIAQLNITHDDLLLAHNYRITCALVSHKDRITVAHKESDETYTEHNLQPDQSTGEIKCGNKVIRERGYKVCSISPLVSPKDQSIDEWLNDLSSTH